MTDLERRIRDLLDEDARSAPQPGETARAVSRTRRRQAVTLAGSALGVVALVAASIAGVRAVLTTDGRTPADAPTVTTTMNGISITYPEGWHVIDPDEAGLNESEPEPAPDFPRIVLALSPVDTGELFGCPGIVEGTMPAFLMTVQEEPLALAGADTAAWPIELDPMDVGTAEGGCYPGWEFLRAGWTASGRTFEARLGLAPEIGSADRQALFDAFASMTFAPGTGTPASSVVLATGTAGGEEWQLVASGQADGLSLSLQAETFGTGTGGFDPSPDQLRITSHVFGDYGDREMVIFGAVPARISTIEAFPPDDAPAISTDVLEVPDEIDARFNAFVLVAPEDLPIELHAYDADGNVLLRGTTGGYEFPQPTPSPDEVIFEGRTNDCLWTLSRASVAPGQDRIDLTAEDTSVGFLADVGPGAPPLQLISFTCPREPGGTLVIGLLTDEVADVRFSTLPPDEHGVPECWPADFPDRFCLFLLDAVGDSGEVIALDANGNEIGRASFP